MSQNGRHESTGIIVHLSVRYRSPAHALSVALIQCSGFSAARLTHMLACATPSGFQRRWQWLWCVSWRPPRLVSVGHSIIVIAIWFWAVLADVALRPWW